MNLQLINVKQLVTVSANKNTSKIGNEMKNLNIIENAFVVVEDGKIESVGEMKNFSSHKKNFMELDCSNYVVLPGFVDSHTHSIFTGSRESEFSMRCIGKTYQEIAESGGGILSTVTNVRNSSKKELKKNARKFLNNMLQLGTTTDETKSGYGLDFQNEIKLLECAKELSNEELSTVVSTFLGAHAIPKEFIDNKNSYVNIIIEEMIPYVAKKNLAQFCDVFCEKNYFEIDDTKKILESAIKNNLKIKLHAEELSYLGGVELGCEFDAVSIDHLEHISESGISALKKNARKKNPTVAVLLPGVSFNLNHQYAPARKIIDNEIPVAIATDFNPGSCMCYSMPFVMTIAATQMNLSVEETISATTINAACALGMSDKFGSIEVGKFADMIIFDLPNYKFIPYHFGENHIKYVIKTGVLLDF